MKKALHLVRFDTRALAVPLGLWTLLLVAEAVQFYIGPSLTTASSELERMATQLGLPILRTAVTTILAAMLVHLDPTVGTAALWKTHPVSRGVLLASKAISAVAWFVLWPWAIMTVPFLLRGLDAGDAVRAGWASAQGQMWVVIPAWAAAVVTATLLHFAMAILGGIAVIALSGGVLGSWLKTTWPWLRIEVTPELSSALGLIALAMAASFIAYQYLTLRLRYTVLWLVAGATIVGLFGSLRSVDYPRWQPPAYPAVPETVIAPSAVTVTADMGTQRIEDALTPGRVQGRDVSFRISWPNEDPDIGLSPVRVDSEVNFANGEQLMWSGWATSPRLAEKEKPPDRQQDWNMMSRLLGNVAIGILVKARVSTEGRVNVITIPEQAFLRHEGETVRLTCTLKLEAYRFRVASVTPLKAGGIVRVNNGVLLIEDIDPVPPGVTIRAREILSTGSVFGPSSSWATGWLLRNTGRRQAIELSIRSTSTYSPNVVFGGVRVPDRRFNLEYNRGGRSPGPFTVDAAWLADAELVRIEEISLGAIRRPMKTKEFVLGAGGQ